MADSVMPVSRFSIELHYSYNEYFVAFTLIDDAKRKPVYKASPCVLGE